MNIKILNLISIAVFVSCSYTAFSQQNGLGNLTEQLQSHVEILSSDSLEGRGLGTLGKTLARDYIASEFRDIGLESFGEDYFHHFEFRNTQGVIVNVYATNIIGYLKGDDPELKDEYILIGAHYDHLGYDIKDGNRIIYPGADDNASGVASMIELARYFASENVTHGRSLIFAAFDAEESGLLGSRWFVDEAGHLIDIRHVKAMFSIDMVGMYSKNEGLELRGIGSIHNGREVAELMASKHGIATKNKSSRIEARTDTWYFGLAGVPSVHVFTGTESEYHEPGDQSEYLDFAGMAIIASYAADMIKELSYKPQLVPSSRFLAQQRMVRFNFGTVASIGRTHHLYPDEFFSADNIFSFGAGLYMQMHMGEKLTFQPEILYDYNGSQSFDGRFKRHSITTLFNMQYNLVYEYGGMIRAYPLAGGYYRYNFSGKYAGQDLDFEDEFKDYEWGYSYGFGMEAMNLQFGVMFQRALSDIYIDHEIKTRSAGILYRIGYRF